MNQKRLTVYCNQVLQAIRRAGGGCFRRFVRFPFVNKIISLLAWLYAATIRRFHYYLRHRLRPYARYWNWRYRHQLHMAAGLCAVFLVGTIFVLTLTRVSASSTVYVRGYATVLNTGEKIYFDPSYGSDVTIDNFSRQMAGYGWSEDIGWVNFGGGAPNPQGPVTAGVTGVLSGKAAVTNTDSYISFNDSGAYVIIANEVFSGYAWSVDLGWVDFSMVTADGYDPDITVPTNATNPQMWRGPGGSEVLQNGWININPYFSWSPADDGTGGSGIAGYCLYLGLDSDGDPKTSKGVLGTSPLDTGGSCPFAVASTDVDLATAGYIASALFTAENPYYLNIKAIDNSHNVYAGDSTTFEFRFDNVPPTNPAFISAPSQFVSSKDVTLTWPTDGGNGAHDANSGVDGLQYKIGPDGIWYGSSHSGAQNMSDLLPNDGSYTTVNPIDYDALVEGNNVVYFRTYDVAGNISAANVTTVIKLNTSSPSAPQNLQATPSTSTTNFFSFSWLPPATFSGSQSNITYCYTINVSPTSSNCTFTDPGVTSLPGGAYATQPGVNTIYVVAKDEAGNINYATAATANFTANTAAPGMPLNIEIADISIKATSNWRLAVSWEAPTNVGAGVAQYRVYRSTDNVNFAQVASTAGTSYVDSGLSQIRYYYKIRACDSANNCGANSATASAVPTGKYTTPAVLVSGPSVTVEPRTATIVWVTDRDSDSRIKYGLSSEGYFDAEVSKSAQTKTHSITLQNLDPDTTYFYKALWTDEDGNTGTTSELTFKTLPAPVVKDIQLSQVKLDSAILQFTSKDAAAVKVYYGLNEGFGGLVTINTSTAESSYTVELTGLNDGATYFYKLNTVDANGYEYDSRRIDSFTTPARPRITNLRFQPVEGEPTSTQRVTWNTNVPSTSFVRYGIHARPITENREVSKSDLTMEHDVVITNLLDDSVYWLVAESRDALGNLATSEEQTFKTELDTRPPKISNVRVETAIRGVGSDARGQLIVSWTTDEPATSQIAYGKGTSGNSYNATTAEAAALTREHTVVISDLDTSQVYHVQAISRDKSDNISKSADRSAIIGQASDSVIDIILATLERIFGL